MFKKIKQIFKGEDEEKTLIWKHEYSADKPNREMIYRFPNPEYPDFSNVEYIGVRDYERVMYYKNGAYVGQLTGGHYEIEEEARTAATEVIWFDPGIVKLTWGVSWSGGVPPRTSDGFAIGASGDIAIQIDDPEALITNVITGQSNYKDSDFKDLIKNIIATSFRDVVKTYTLEGFLGSDRDSFNNRMKTSVADQFRRYGIQIDVVQFLSASHPPKDALLVEEITERLKKTTVSDSRAVQDEIETKQQQLKTLKDKIAELEMNYAMGEIDEDELNSKLPPMKNLVKQREEEIAELKTR